MTNLVTLIPNAKQQFCDGNGVPAAAGAVEMFEPGTNTHAPTWSDSAGTILNANPLTLDAAGRAQLWGIQGTQYRQLVTDLHGVVLWDQITEAPAVGAATATTVYDLIVFIEGISLASELYPIVDVARGLSLPAGLTGSQFSILVNPTSTLTYTFFKNGSSLGTVSFSTSGVPSVSFGSGASFVAGDKFSIQAPGTPDATGAGVSMTLVFSA